MRHLSALHGDGNLATFKPYEGDVQIVFTKNIVQYAVLQNAAHELRTVIH